MNFLLNLFSGSYEELWKAIIRPYRDNYTEKDLGPEKFRINSKYYKRTDLTLRNSRNQILMCSYWEPYDEEREYTYLPCVIYLHGNSSSRCEVIPNLKYLLPLNITVFAFDFAACGHSEGEYISLGWYEIFDVKCVINYLRKSNKVSAIGLWGRSMGAVTSIMYAEKDPTIGGIFLDSPFFSLNLLMDELSKEKVAFPSFLVKQVLIKVKETVKEKAKFNIDDINTEKFCKKCFVPSFFCHGKDDNFVRVHHCEDLYKIYPGEKNILIVEGDHNDIRPDELNEKAAEFFYYALKCKYIKEMNDYNFGYKLIINDWNNPKFRTPTGNEKNINNKNKDINKPFIGFKGSFPWCAPEVLSSQYYGIKCDIWSLGCAIIEMGGLEPWNNKINGIYEFIDIVGKSKEIPEIPKQFSNELKDFVLHCLEKDPDKRADTDFLLNHCFITQTKMDN